MEARTPFYKQSLASDRRVVPWVAESCDFECLREFLFLRSNQWYGFPIDILCERHFLTI